MIEITLTKANAHAAAYIASRLNLTVEEVIFSLLKGSTNPENLEIYFSPSGSTNPMSTNAKHLTRSRVFGAGTFHP